MTAKDKAGDDERYVKVPAKRHRPKHFELLLMVAVCLAAAFLPPVLIGGLFSLGERHPVFIVPWSAGEALAYCAAVSAAVIAIAGVIFSVRSARNSQESSLRDEAAPFFSAIFLDQQNKRSALNDFFQGREPDSPVVQDAEEQEAEYREVETRNIYILLGDEVKYRRRLSDEERINVESSTLIEKIGEGARAIVVPSVIYLPVRMRNVGNGVAVGVRIGLNKPEEAWSGVSLLTLEVGQEFYLGIYVDTDKQAAFGDYELRIVYSDRLGYQYQQVFELHVKKAEGLEKPAADSRSEVQISYLGTRLLLNNEERRAYLESMTTLAS